VNPPAHRRPALRPGDTCQGAYALTLTVRAILGREETPFGPTWRYGLTFQGWQITDRGSEPMPVPRWAVRDEWQLARIPPLGAWERLRRRFERSQWSWLPFLDDLTDEDLARLALGEPSFSASRGLLQRHLAGRQAVGRA
jgi:hypothetical protein